MKILFLDIDGVMNRFNPDRHHDVVEDDLIENLKYVIEKTNCQIVISSTWKASYNLMDILEEELFPKLPKGCIYGCTPTLLPQKNREHEIDWWFKHHYGEVEEYVIVDDYDFELKSYIEKDKCVITDALYGFTRENAEECIRRLNKC